MQKTKTTMADGMLALSWNNHATTFCHMLSHIRLKDKYADATVACEGKFYPVHRIVLSTCSKYFEEMFELTSAGKHPIVLLQDVRKYELESILSYMYAGVVSVAQKDLARLIKVAELLQIKGLAVPDELPSDRRGGNQNSANVSERTTKTSHALEHSDDKASPYRKRRRRDEVPPQAPGPSFNKDEDEIQEIKQSDYLSKDFEDSNKEDENRRLGLDRTENAMLSLEGRTSESEQSQQQTSLDAVRKASKDPKDDLLWIKEEVVDDPAENAGNAVKTELSFESMGEAGDESVDRAFNDQEDYSQPSHSQMPTDAAAEALAGPSGIHEWLSGGDLAAMENYGGEGSPPTSDHPQAQQLDDLHVGAKVPKEAAAKEGRKVEEGNGGRQGRTAVVGNRARRGRKAVVGNGGKQRRNVDEGNGGRQGSETEKGSEGREADLALGGSLESHEFVFIYVNGQKRFLCPLCSHMSQRKCHLIWHIRSHTGFKPHKCEHCPAAFSQQPNLKKHMLKHAFKCSLCPETFQKEHLLQAHLNKQHVTVFRAMF